MKNKNIEPLRNDLFDKIEKAIRGFFIKKDIYIDEFENKTVYEKIIEIVQTFDTEDFLLSYMDTGKPEPLTISLIASVNPQNRNRERKIWFINVRSMRIFMEKIIVYSNKHIVIVYNQKVKYEKKFQ